MTGAHATLLLLVRHAHTDAVGTRLLGRGPCPGINEHGRAQADRLAERLAAAPLTALYTSPALRTRQTAERIAAHHGLQPLEHAAFAEVDFGTWTGRSFAELDADPVWRDYNTRRSVTRIPGGELMLDVQARAVAATLQLAVQHRGGTIAVVSHADVIRGIIGHILGAPVDNLLRIAVEPASVSTIAFHDGSPQLTGLNRTA